MFLGFQAFGLYNDCHREDSTCFSFDLIKVPQPCGNETKISNVFDVDFDVNVNLKLTKLTPNKTFPPSQVKP